MPHQILEFPLLHNIIAFDFISEFLDDLFNLILHFFGVTGCWLAFILDGPNDLIMKHLLNAALKMPLLQQELNMRMIVIITHD